MRALEGKVAIVTGGTSGIGARCAERFAEEGARVVITGRRAEEGEAVVRRIGSAAKFFRADVAAERDVAATIEHTVAVFGRLDCLVNNAGHAGRVVSILETEAGEIDELLAVHVRAVALGIKHAAPVMIRQGSGSIINVASLAGTRSGFSPHVYSAAKAAAIHLARCVAVELGEEGIRVNSISPGPTLTGIFGKALGLSADAAERTTEALKPLFAELQPIRRAGLPDDVAQAAVYLASDASSFVNGHDLVVDGGNVGGRRWPQMLEQWAGAKQLFTTPTAA